MRAGKQAALGVLAVAVTVSVASCRQVAGVGDPRPPPACGRANAMVPACNGCVVDRCCTEVEACDLDPNCVPLLDCLAGCADDTCTDACEGRAKPTDAAAALLACRASSCDSSCTAGCGGAGAPISGCKPCAAGCCGDGRAFRGSIDGRRLRACRFACPKDDVGCREECTTTHAKGADLERAARECVIRSCSVPGNWSCVGSVTAQRVEAPKSISFSVSVFDARTISSIRDVVVTGCSTEELSCPVANYGTGTSDTRGNVKLKIPLAPFAGRDAYTGFVQLTHPDYVPELVYLFPGVAMDSGIDVLMLSKSFFASFSALAGMPLAADRGMVAIANRDCSGYPRRGMSVRLVTPDPEARTFYVGSASAGEAAYDFNGTATGEAGGGGVFNVKAGLTKIALSVEDLCLDLGTIEVGVRAGTVTFVGFGPLP